MRTVPVHMYIVVPVRLNFQFHLFQFLSQTDSEKKQNIFRRTRQAPQCCGYVVVVVDCRVQMNGGHIVDVLWTMVGMVSILEC